jgi:hypothetical protein
MKNRGRVQCPASLEDEGAKPHYCTRRELKENGGVCRRCAGEFRSRHTRAVARTQAEEEQPRHAVRDPDVHFADGHREPCVGFQFPEPEGDGRDEKVEYAAQAVVAFAKMLTEKARTSRRVWQVLNALLFAAQVHPSQEMPMKWFARRFHITKANFCHEVNYWRDLLGLPRVGGSKSTESRRKYSAVQTIKHHERHQEQQEQRARQNGSEETGAVNQADRTGGPEAREAHRHTRRQGEAGRR